MLVKEGEEGLSTDELEEEAELQASEMELTEHWQGEQVAEKKNELKRRKKSLEEWLKEKWDGDE